MNEKDILHLIKNDSWMMKIIKNTNSLHLSDWWIGAGFVRGKVWDTLHGYSISTPLPDVDVIYFNTSDFRKEEINSESTKMEKKYEESLRKIMPDITWSVTNQARMHVFHNDNPYKNSTEALSRWVETATCIGITLDEADELKLAAPHGITDLTNLILRPTFNTKRGIEIFNRRIREKEWLKKWPNLKIVGG